MDFETLCAGIQLQEEIRVEAIRYYRSEEFQKMRPLAEGLKSMETEAEARKRLRQLSGTDERHVKMLVCMLSCALQLHEWYVRSGISDTIYFDSMGCFTRFIRECRQKTGVLAFDREWWTARQASGNLFRLGALEYEKKYEGTRPVISVHIPSDACLKKEACEESIQQAKGFFQSHFPEYARADYVCHSWLLAPELSGLLPEKSNIRDFQERFEIVRTDEASTDYTEWVFQTESSNIADYPERTSLQKTMKQHLLRGGKISSGYGLLKY